MYLQSWLLPGPWAEGKISFQSLYVSLSECEEVESCHLNPLVPSYSFPSGYGCCNSCFITQSGVCTAWLWIFIHQKTDSDLFFPQFICCLFQLKWSHDIPLIMWVWQSPTRVACHKKEKNSLCLFNYHVFLWEEACVVIGLGSGILVEFRWMNFTPILSPSATYWIYSGCAVCPETKQQKDTMNGVVEYS